MIIVVRVTDLTADYMLPRRWLRVTETPLGRPPELAWFAVCHRSNATRFAESDAAALIITMTDEFMYYSFTTEPA